MAEYARILVYDDATVDSETTHAIWFRPGRPGLITASTTPLTRPGPSESGVATGALALLRSDAGSDEVLVSQQFTGDGGTAVSYTAQEITDSTQWFCRVFNGTLAPLGFDTEITFESQYPVQTATFDLNLFDELMDELLGVAQFHIHVETSDPPDPASSDSPVAASYVSWSPDLARALNGVDESSFHVDDVVIFTTDLDIPFLEIALPDSLVFRPALDSEPLTSPVFQAGDGAYVIRVDFAPTVIPCLNENRLDITVDSLSMTVSVGLDGEVGVLVNASASARVDGHSLLDVSGRVEAAVTAAVEGHLTRRKLLRLWESLFVRLLRLDDTRPPGVVQHPGPFSADAHTLGYTVDGDVLTALFY